MGLNSRAIRHAQWDQAEARYRERRRRELAAYLMLAGYASLGKRVKRRKWG
jgi:hypothetical protein